MMEVVELLHIPLKFLEFEMTNRVFEKSFASTEHDFLRVGEEAEQVCGVFDIRMIEVIESNLDTLNGKT